MSGQPDLRALTSPRFVLGLAAIVVGILFLGDNLGWFESEPLVEWWPAALVVVGALKLLGGGGGWGMLWMAAGGWLLLDHLGYVRVSLWDAAIPLALFGFGGLLVYRSLGRSVKPSNDGSGAEDLVHANAILGGLQRRSHSQAFRGGDALALMGGCEIDLRGAKLAPEGATLDIVAFWGGIEVWVPEDWEVDCQVMPIMGAVEERLPRTASASPGTDTPRAAPPRLVVRGVAVMGGVDIANAPAKPAR